MLLRRLFLLYNGILMRIKVIILIENWERSQSNIKKKFVSFFFGCFKREKCEGDEEERKYQQSLSFFAREDYTHVITQLHDIYKQNIRNKKRNKTSNKRREENYSNFWIIHEIEIPSNDDGLILCSFFQHTAHNTQYRSAEHMLVNLKIEKKYFCIQLSLLSRCRTVPRSPPPSLLFSSLIMYSSSTKQNSNSQLNENKHLNSIPSIPLTHSFHTPLTVWGVN